MKSWSKVKDFQRFLDTKIIYSNDATTTEPKHNDRTLPVHWSSQVQKRCKRNAITSDLNRATRIVCFPADEITKMRKNKSFLMLTIDIDLSIVSLIYFKENQIELTNTSFAPAFFDVWKKVVLVDIPYCPKND